MTLEKLYLGSFTFFPDILFFLFCPWFILLSFTMFTSQYRISVDGLQANYLRGDKCVKWKQVKEVWVNMNYFGGYNVLLVVEEQKRHITLFTSFLKNQKEVTKAIMEAATVSNPQVVLRGQWQSAYGTPPFGIFSELETSSATPQEVGKERTENAIRSLSSFSET